MDNGSVTGLGKPLCAPSPRQNSIHPQPSGHEHMSNSALKETNKGRVMLHGKSKSKTKTTKHVHTKNDFVRASKSGLGFGGRLVATILSVLSG